MATMPPQVRSHRHQFEKKILEHLKKREEKIMKNELLAGVLLYPRYCFLLTSDEVIVAKGHLTQLYFVINNIKDQGKKNNDKIAALACSSDDIVCVILYILY